MGECGAYFIVFIYYIGMDSGVDNTSNPEIEFTDKQSALTEEQRKICSEARVKYGYCAKDAKKIENENEKNERKAECVKIMRAACRGIKKGGRSRPRTRRPRTRRTKRASRRNR